MDRPRTQVTPKVVILLLVAQIALCTASSSAGTDRILVILDAVEEAEKYTTILTSLREARFELELKIPAEEPQIMSSRDRRFFYAGILLLAPRATTLGRHLPVQALMEFVDKGGHLLVAVTNGYSDFLEQVVREIGVELDDKQNRVIDHSSFDSDLDDGSHTTVVAGGYSRSKPLTDGQEFSHIVFRGVGGALIEDNELVTKLLWGSTYAYGYRDRDAMQNLPMLVGRDTVLVSALQTRVSSRAVFVGSVDMLTDAMIDAAGKGHRNFVTRLVQWTFGQRGVLRAENLHFTRVGETEERLTYRIRDELVVYIDIFEYHRTEDTWKPLMETDVQVEFTSLDPYVRADLRPEGNGTFSADIPVPDHIGIYKFTVDYFRPGYTPISVSRQVSIRPYLHNEYERFILRATPYYISAILNLIGVFVFGLVFLYGKQN